MNTSGQNDDETDEVEVENSEVQHQDTGFYEFKKFHSGILTIGCVGQPNVGKSSLINALMGKKVVSVSKTPGHTKHFQTIFLTPNVRLCDCPGLIFPSKVPKPLQVILFYTTIEPLYRIYFTSLVLLPVGLMWKLSHSSVEGTLFHCAIPGSTIRSSKNSWYSAPRRKR